MSASTSWHGYRAYGLTLASEIQLAELHDDDWRRAALWIRRGADLEDDPGVVADSVAGSARVERTAAGLTLGFDGPASFVVSPDSRSIEVRTAPSMAESSLTHLLIDTVLPTVLSERGELVLHASGIALEGGAVLFVGPSGAGKSTLAAVLARRGWPVVCDDAARLVFSGLLPAVVPSYPGLRLWPTGLHAALGPVDGVREVTRSSSKVRWVPGEQPADPVPLAGICLFEDGEGSPRAVAAPPRDALRDLIGNSYRVRGLDPDRVQQQFERAGEIVEATPLYRLFSSYDYDKLGQLADLVETLGLATPSPRTPPVIDQAAPVGAS